MNKYHNCKCLVDNIEFDSKKEANYYLELKQKVNQGLISDLKLQVKYELIPSFKLNGHSIRPMCYIADFTYRDKDLCLHIIDTKGFRTDVYKIKKKIFEYKYKIEIEEK